MIYDIKSAEGPIEINSTGPSADFKLMLLLAVKSESFNNNLLDYPVYTRPAEFRGMKVPEVLLSGHHENINKYRNEERIRVTKENRSDLVKGE